MCAHAPVARGVACVRRARFHARGIGGAPGGGGGITAHGYLNVIDPKDIVLHRIIGEGSFGRVWAASWRSSHVAVKEFVFAQAAVNGNSAQKRDIIEEIVGEAAIMSYLRHPRILQLFGCSLTVQAIWIVSEVRSSVVSPRRQIASRRLFVERRRSPPRAARHDICVRPRHRQLVLVEQGVGAKA